MRSNSTISYITLVLLIIIGGAVVFFDAPQIPHQTAAVADFNNALVAYYSFDDGTGADNSGKGNGGTLSGGSPFAGKVNGAISFASGGSVAVSKSLYTSYPVTLCAWVKPDLKGNGLLSKIIGNSGFDLVMQESDGAEKFIVYNNVNEVLTPYASRYSAGAWHHVCGMVDSGAQASIYVDGALAAGPANLGTANNFWNINIGNNFPGIVDEVRVYNTALNPGQVSDVYSYTGSPNSVTPPNPDPNPNPNPNPDPNPPSIPVVNGLCSPTVNMCAIGTFSDVADTDTEQKWSCAGSGGGTTASCSIPKPAVVPDPDPIPNQPVSNELIPSDRLYDWTNNVGVMGGIPTGRSVCASVKSAPYNAVGDGVTDDTQAIVDAIRACAGKSQAVYFPAGTYKFTSKVIDQGTGRRSTNLTYSNITFRGAGMGKTILKPYMTDVLYVGNGDWPPPVPTITITGRATRGSSTLTVDNAGSITEGKLITITQINPNWVHSNDRFYGGGPVDDGHDQTRLMAITVLVKSKSGNTITIDHPLPIDMPNSPMITLWQNIVKNTGFEDMTIDMTNSTGQSGILFNQVYGCWVKGVEIKKPENRFLWFTTVSNCEVRDSYFHDARVTKKEGVDFYQNDTFNLIENNVLVRAGGPMIILGDFGGGVSMNVVAYNYLEDQEGWSDVVPYALSDNHGAHNMFNLFEGNVAQNFSSDGYYGGASHETIFRNRFTSVYGQAPNRNYDYLWQYAIHLGHWAVNYNVVGNVLGSPGYASVYQPSSLNYPGGTKAIYRLGFPDCCNSGYSGTGSNPTNSLTFDTNVEATLVRHGNFDYFSNSVKWAPNISVRSLPVSLYLRGQPSWWNTWGGTAFPPIGPDVSGYAQQIPAQLRYQAILSNSDIAPPEPSIPPAPNACTSFTYSAWGMCSNNVQSRTILTSSPAGCTGGVPVTTQACSLPKKAEADLLVEKPVALDVVVQKPIPTPQVTPTPTTPTPSFISRFIPSLGSSKKTSPYTVTSNKTPGEFVPIPDASEEDVITRAESSLTETVKTIFSYIAARIVNGFYRVIGK